MVSESHEIDELLEELRSQLGAPDVVTALRECARYGGDLAQISAQLDEHLPGKDTDARADLMAVGLLSGVFNRPPWSSSAEIACASACLEAGARSLAHSVRKHWSDAEGTDMDEVQQVAFDLALKMATVFIKRTHLHALSDAAGLAGPSNIPAANAIHIELAQINLRRRLAALGSLNTDCPH